MKSFLFTVVFIFHHLSIAQIQETQTMAECLNRASQESSNLSSRDVFYVFDIDNTVLALNQNLGSVQWFRWQQKLIQVGLHQHTVATTIEELLDKQLLLYQMIPAHTPEPEIPDLLKDLQIKGHSVVYHTSRNTDVRDITERELTKNRLLPLIKTIGPDRGYPGKMTFQNGPQDQRPVSFQNGVYISAGQDKGVFLKLLFEKTSFMPRHLVFVDDELKNLQNIERAFKGTIPMTLCRYGSMDQTVEKFQNSDKQQEIDLWKKIEIILHQLAG